MSEDNSAAQTTTDRIPAHELLISLLKEHNLSFYIRPQKVRYVEDNSLIIEAPTIIVQYTDIAQENEKVTGEQVNG